MSRIAIFYHGVYIIEGKLLDAAVPIIHGQMRELESSGLLAAADEFHVGINGSTESLHFAKATIPSKARVVFHGTESRNELSTLLMLEQWVKAHKGEAWFVWYFHSKGATHPQGHDHSTKWRNCCMKHMITNWQRCVLDLAGVYEAAGVHFMEYPNTPKGQAIFAGNFWAVKSSYLETVPSIMERARIKISGVHSKDSRYEAEVALFNGPRMPKLRDYHPNWHPGKIETCV